MSDLDGEFEKLTAAIAGLEAQRAVLGDAVVDPAVGALRQRLAQIESSGGENADERKLVTIVFADVSGFTALSETLDPEEVRALLNACFDWLVPVVQKYDGAIDKFIGDEIMALFGAPVAHEDDAERALRAALEMMGAITAFNVAHQTQLGLHLGINTGLVVAGQMGGTNRNDYSVMGDAVNLAARLEDASSEGEIFVGAATHRLTRHAFEFEPIAPMTLKGKSAPVEVHRLIRLKATPQRARGLEGLRAPLVGRAQELTTIREAIDALGRGEGIVLALIGEAGLGKSRLIAEARALLPANTRWAEGRALSYTTGMSYWLAREILLSLLEVSTQESPVEIAEALRRSIGPERHAELFPYLASMLALPLAEADEELVKFLPGEVRQARVLAAMRAYVRTCAELQPLVLVWEDLHWCDPSSRQILETLLPLTREIPLFILLAARPEEEAPQKEEGKFAYRTLRLLPLTRNESGSLIRELLQIENLPEQMRELILSRAEGNPFFLEELLRSLIDAGAVVIAHGQATATSAIVSVEIPETVQGVLAARIDRLHTEQKQALQRASVIGRVFQQPVLSHLYREDARSKQRLNDALHGLQQREFILSHEQGASETAALEKDEYIFKHAITHDVAYDSMLRARRKELHGLAAAAIESLFPERLDELSATLGYHHERGENAERAAHYLGRAAARAKAAFANTEAIAFYKSALAARERMPEQTRDQSAVAQLSEDLGDVLTLSGHHDEARVALERAISSLAETEQVWRSRVYRKLGFSHSLQRHFEATARAYDDADRQLGEERADRKEAWWEEKVQIQMERMHLFYWEGRVPEMRSLADKFHHAITQRGTPIQRGKFLKLLALSLLMDSRFRPSSECVALAQQAVQACEGAADLSEASHVRFALGLIQLWRGNFAEAIKHCTDALEFSERVGDIVLQTRCVTYRAAAYRRLGDIVKTERDAQRALVLATELTMVEYIGMADAHLAWVAWSRGEDALAEKLGSEALKLWHGMDDPYGFDWMALFPLMALAMERKETERALDHAAGLLGENQHPLPEELTLAVRTALDSAQTTAALEQVLAVARRLNYL